MPHVITGVVRDADGEPVAGAVVSLTAGPVPLPDIAVLSAADGGFSITAPVPGGYEVTCNLPGGDAVRRQVRVSEADQEIRLDVSR